MLDAHGGFGSVELRDSRLRGLLAPLMQASALALAADSAHAQAAPCNTTLSGVFATAQICAPASGPASIATDVGTSITTSGTVGIRATARNNQATIQLNGTNVTSTNPGATTSAAQVQVLLSSGNTTPGNASANFEGGPSSITLQGNGLDAVAVTNASAGDSSIAVAPGSSLNIANTATGNEHDGLDINATGGGNATVSHAGVGTISVAGGNAVWVKAAGAGQISVQVGAGNTLSVANADAVSAASNHAGIQTRTLGTGMTSVDNGATILSSGAKGHGIFVTAATGDTMVQNTGSITTTGADGSGIRIGATGNIQVRNSGAITTGSTTAHGIYVNPGLAAAGNVSVDNQGALTVGGPNDVVGARGIYLIGRSTGTVTVTGNGDITVQGSPTTSRGQGIIISADAGNASVTYGGAMSVRGAGAGGIRADSVSGNVAVAYTGSGIETFNANGNGIYATTASATGTVDIAAQGRIVTHANLDGSGDGTGGGSFGLQGWSQGGDVSVAFSGPIIDVNGTGAAILASNAYGGTGLGALTVDNSGSLLARGDRQQGIHTRSSTGTQTIANQGPIQTLGATASPGILAEGTGAATIGVVNSGTITTRGNDSSGIDVSTQGGSVEVRNSQPVSAGWGTSAGVAMNGMSQVLINSSHVQALSDAAVRADNTNPSGALEVVPIPIDIDPPETTAPEPDPGVDAAAQQKPRGVVRMEAPGDVGIVIDNTGQLDGTVSAVTSSVNFNNGGMWNLRSFADTDGDGVRDTWSVARSDLGSGSGNHINNTGTLNLVAQPATGIAAFNAADAYLPLGQVANSPALGGPVQGQLLGVGTFTHGGSIDLTGGGTVVGNVLVISGGRTAGQDGGGVFVSNGGRLKVNTVLNAGGAESRSDMLVVDSTRTAAGGPTRIQVNNAGGAGALTPGNGIAVVELTNKLPAASDANAFALDGRAVAGAYEYRLLRGSVDGSGTDAWYLRSQQDPTPPPPFPPTPSDNPIPPPPAPEPLYRPEVGAYLANQRQAGGMFLHSLHDRLGEPQWIESQQFEKVDDRRRAGWLRLVGRNTDSTSRDGVFDVDTDSYLIQGGGDIARWSVFKDRDQLPADRLHLGLTLGYGKADTSATARGNPARAYGTAEGWSVGGYATWYQNDESKLGGYTDLWGTYGWFKNSVRGEALPEVKYDANALTLSAETGYAMRVRDDSDWIIEPQAQVVYVKYSEDDIAEPNGTRVHGGEGSGWIGRLGLRTHRTWTRESGRKVQPYATLNWWHDRTDNTLAFNQVQLEGMYPRNRYEVKLGVNADFNKGWTGWANVGYLWGSQGYRSIAGRVGAKYAW